MSIFKEDEKVTFSVKIDPALKEEIDTIKKELKGIKKSLSFPIDELLEKELKKVIKKARNELDNLNSSDNTVQ